jgi:hypothetical protein
MSMPKGHKFNHGYATSEGGMGYREIAEKCSEEGHKMNHATARNYFLRAMEKLAEPICELFPGKDPDQVAKDPRFQRAVAELIEEETKNGDKIVF